MTKPALRPSIIVTACVLGISLAACGSTVATSAQSLGGSNPSGDLGLPSASGTGVGHRGNLATGSSLPSSQASGSVGGNNQTGQGISSGSSVTPSGVQAGGPPLNNGPGVSPTKISIGFVYAAGADQAQKALGNTSGTSGNVKGEADAVIADINGHGGVAGRALDVVFHAVNANDTASTAAQTAQATCADFTQDHHVLVGAPMANPTFISCMSKAGAVSSGASAATLTDADYAKFPQFYDVLALAVNKIVINLVDTLVSSGYFAKWDTATGQPGIAPVKVGILAPDLPQWSQVIPQVIVPELAKHGITVAPQDVYIWHFPDSKAGNGQSVAEIQAAVLKFRSDNVTHIILAEQNSAAFFAPSAESQNYRPRYGINSTSGIQVYAGSLIPYAQLNGATGLGWYPGLDLPASRNPDNGPYSGPGQAHCLKVMRARGITFSDPTAKATAFNICDELYSIRDALNAIPRTSPINASTYMAALSTLGGAFQVSALPTALFGPRQHYPVTRGYTLQYFADCKCTHYTGQPFTLR